jgi:hypothetical protein
MSNVTNRKHYIFRYKASGICVTPSRRKSAKKVWEFAIEGLRPAGMGDKAAEKFVRENGEVVEDDTE